LFIAIATCIEKQSTRPLSAQLKDTTREIADVCSVCSHYPFLMLNAKQESCEF